MNSKVEEEDSFLTVQGKNNWIPETHVLATCFYNRQDRKILRTWYTHDQREKNTKEDDTNVTTSAFTSVQKSHNEDTTVRVYVCACLNTMTRQWRSHQSEFG